MRPGTPFVALVVLCSCYWRLVLFRNFFHLVYVMAVLAALAYFFKSRRRSILLAGALPLLARPGTLHEELDSVWILFGQHLDGHEHGYHHRASTNQPRSARLRESRRLSRRFRYSTSARPLSFTARISRCQHGPASPCWMNVLLPPAQPISTASHFSRSSRPIRAMA